MWATGVGTGSSGRGLAWPSMVNPILGPKSDRDPARRTRGNRKYQGTGELMAQGRRTA